jgi:hypothetical protein
MASFGNVVRLVAPYIIESPMKRLLIRFAILILLVVAVFWAYPSSKPWAAFGSDAQFIAKYYALEKCQREAGKTGGWCGKNCKDYGNEFTTDCHPLVRVPQKSQDSK